MGAERPTLDTVAAAAGVSRMTVSNAYNRPDQLSGETRARVLAVAEQLGYAGPDPAARSLRRGRAGTIGVLMTERLPYAFLDPGMVLIMAGIAGELSAAGRAMLLVPSGVRDSADVVRGAVVDAFVVCSMDEHDEALVAVRARRLPLVVVGSPRLTGVPLVGVDNRRAGSLAAAHLLDLGHRQLGVVDLRGRQPGDPEDPNLPVRFGIHERAQGFSRAVASRGGATTVARAAEHSHDEGVTAALSLLDRPPAARPSAVFAVTDVLALAVLDAAERLGIDVPGELSVVGFDDIAAAGHSRPPLTTVRQELQGLGRAAATVALDLVAGRPARVADLRAELVVRGSSAPPRPAAPPEP